MDDKKKYEEAERLYQTANADQRYVLESLFPKLRESEDEKIRKTLIDFFEDWRKSRSHCWGISVAKILAWLEKQGNCSIKWNKNTEDNKPQVNHSVLIQTSNGIAEGEWNGGEHWIQYRWSSSVKDSDVLYWAELSDVEKQGEQKPAEKAEPKFKVKYAGSEYNVFETKDIAGVTFYGIEDEPNHIDYVKAENCEIISVYAIKENGSPYPTKPAVFSEQKPQRMISAEAKEALLNESEREALRTEYEKGRADAIAEIQKEWSEEDERNLQGIIDEIEANKNNAPDYDLATYDRFLSWLKSLKNRYTWKPSDKQMEAIRIAAEVGTANDSWAMGILRDVYNDLKKLKGK